MMFKVYNNRILGQTFNSQKLLTVKLRLLINHDFYNFDLIIIKHTYIM